MKPLKNFKDFIEDGIVKKQRRDDSRAVSLKEEAENRKRFIDGMIEKIGISDENANYFIESAYDVLIELIRAKLLLDGFNASGSYAHEAEVSYLRELDFSEFEIRFMNDLRYWRNGIKYYGERLDKDYAEKVLKFLDDNYTKLKKLVEDALH